MFTTHLGNIRNPAFLSGWDITDPEAPVQLPALQEEGISYETVDVANHNIFVGLHENGLGVYNYDASNGFTRVGHLGGFTNAWGVAARDDHVFVADGVGGFATVDATNPAQPVELGRVAVGGQARGVVVDGNFAYVASGSAGVAVVDISDLASPKVVGRAEMPGTALRVAYSEKRIFVAAWNDVRVYDVSEPAAPRFIAAVRIPGPSTMTMPTASSRPCASSASPPAARTCSSAPGRTPTRIASSRTASRPTSASPRPRPASTSARSPWATPTRSRSRSRTRAAPLTLVDNWISGAAFTVEPKQARIQPGETVTLEVTYAASSTEQEVGYLNIVSDDPASPIRKAYLVGNSPGLSVGAPLPAATGTMLDSSTWTSAESEGKVLLLTYFATFCPVEVIEQLLAE